MPAPTILLTPLPDCSALSTENEVCSVSAVVLVVCESSCECGADALLLELERLRMCPKACPREDL